MQRLQRVTVSGATQRACEAQLGGRRAVDQLLFTPFSLEAPPRQLATSISIKPAGCPVSRALRTSSRSRVGVCCAVGREAEVGLADSDPVEGAVEAGSSATANGSSGAGDASRGVSSAASPAVESDSDNTVCMFSGNVITDPEKLAQKQQEKVIEQLTYAQIVFPALAVSRFVDALPGILAEDGNTYAEIVTVISAVDPFLVGIFAYGTATAMKKILESEKQGDETVEVMREKAMDSLVNFFERANLVVFGVVLATVSRLVLEGAAASDQWADIEHKLLEYFDTMLEAFGVGTAVFFHANL